MLDDLVIHNYPSSAKLDIAKDILSDNHIQAPFILQTCQRTLVITMKSNEANIFHHADRVCGSEAYNYLLQIICGLKSKLVGENEIVSQFKQAFRHYLASNNKDNQILLILEKLFKDSKEIRTQYLTGLSQKTYASIARKKIVNQHKASEVVILGSGLLAEDLINQFKKKINVKICARNAQRVQQFCKDHAIESIEWLNLDELSKNAFIVNSIGFDGILLDDKFFDRWSMENHNKLFIDLGSPSCIQTQLDLDSGIMKLDDIFQEGAVHENHKKNQINLARKALDSLVEKRHRVFQQKVNFKARYAYS